jgi:nucleoside-diphosphate-sugar epimerase
VHARDVGSLFRLALEKGSAGRYWHPVGNGAIPVREIAEAIGNRLGLPAISVPLDELMLAGHRQYGRGPAQHQTGTTALERSRAAVG